MRFDTLSLYHRSGAAGPTLRPRPIPFVLEYPINRTLFPVFQVQPDHSKSDGTSSVSRINSIQTLIGTQSHISANVQGEVQFGGGAGRPPLFACSARMATHLLHG